MYGFVFEIGGKDSREKNAEYPSRNLGDCPASSLAKVSSPATLRDNREALSI
jgi:hypothetical protein